MSIGVMTSSCSMTQVFIFELTTCPEIKGFHYSEWEMNLLHVNEQLELTAVSWSDDIIVFHYTGVYSWAITSSVEIKGLHCSEWEINLLHVNVLWKNDNRYLWHFKTWSMSRKLSIWSVIFVYFQVNNVAFLAVYLKVCGCCCEEISAWNYNGF